MIRRIMRETTMSKNHKLSREEVWELSIKDRIKYVEKINVQYPRATTIFEALKDAYELAPFASEPPCVALIGHPGVGKTTLLKRIVNSHPLKITETGMIQHVVRVKIPARPTLESIATA